MENHQDTPTRKSCCSTDKTRCHGKHRCAGKLLGGLLVLGLVAGLAFCAGSKYAQAGSSAVPGVKMAAQEADRIPTLRP